MKTFVTAVFAGVMMFSTAVYAKEEPKKEVTAEVKKDAAPAPQTKQVCVDLQGNNGKPVIDAKTKKVKQRCVTVKVREKFEGTKIEDAKKK